MRTLGPLSTSPWPSSRAPPAAAVSVTGKVADNHSFVYILIADVWRSNGEEWYRLRSGVQRLMLDLQSVGTFLPLINPVADDFVQRILHIRDPDTGVVESLDNEIAKWNLECEFV